MANLVSCKMDSKTIVTLALLLALSFVNGVPTVEEYLQQRNRTFQNERSVGLGSNQVLHDPRETRVNEILMDFKGREYKEGVDSNGAHFTTARHFFHMKELIEASNVFKIIRLLPKGASLHTHDDTVATTEYLVNNLTHWDNLFYCVDSRDYVTFRFFDEAPAADCVSGRKWELVSDLRNSSSSQEFVDDLFFKSMSLVTPTPNDDYPDINTVWKIFEEKIGTISGMAKYLPAMKEHYKRNLLEMYEDNVMYVEERGILSDVYRLNQTYLTPLEILDAYEEAAEEFKLEHPDFFGAKYIYAPHRFHPPPEVADMINMAVQMKANHPDFFAGFDLVGQEDLGTPLLGFLPQLLDAAAKGIKFFFHAGETAWHGTKVDENLIDAILLNTTRLGHAYALASHPLLAEQAKEAGIAVESCPISNQVLRLVDDFRNHPAIPLMTEGFPLVIGSDNPGMWGASGLSYDWYVAFMAMAGGRADLRFLKQLAINSIKYSAMTPTEKTAALTKWENQWSQFLDKVVALYDPQYKDQQDSYNNV